MTCIIAVGKDKDVYMAADTLGSNGHNNSRDANSKIIKMDGGVLVGYSASYRLGQLLRYEFKIPSRRVGHLGDSHMYYMITKFIPRLQVLFGVNEYDMAKDEASLVVAFDGEVFLISHDLSVFQPMDGVMAIGSGAETAMGAYYGIDYLEKENFPKEEDRTPELKRLRHSVRAAKRLIATVGGTIESDSVIY